MGNRLGCTSGEEEEDDDSCSLSCQEKEAVKKKFLELCPKESSFDEKKENFCRQFASREVKEIPLAIFKACIPDRESKTPSLKSLQRFVSDVSRSNSRGTIQSIWSLLPQKSKDRYSLSKAFFLLMLEFSGCEQKNLDITADRMIGHMKFLSSKSRPNNFPTNSGVEMDTESELRELNEWVNEYAPHSAKVFVTYFNHIFFPEMENQGSYQPFVPPQIELSERSDIVQSTCELMPLALYDITLQSRWKRLYTTQHDGLSFNRIAHHILGYGGPNVILIQCAGKNVVLGAYNEDGWKDSNRFYGSSSSFLFTLLSHFHIFRSKATSNGAYQWLNLKSYGMPHGLGMGGDLEKFRLYIPDTLEDCVARSNCLTFETGSFFRDSNSSEFDIEIMEVWGCGGETFLHDALEAQSKDRGDRDALIQKARQVDKAQFANNKFDQEFLLGKNFQHKVRMVDDACQEMAESKVGKQGVTSNVV